MAYGDLKFRRPGKRDAATRRRSLAIQTAVWGGAIGGAMMMAAAAVTLMHG